MRPSERWYIRTDPTGARITGRALTLADSKRQSLQHLYRTDPRVAPWAGTAHGVLQAVNTYHHHESLITLVHPHCSTRSAVSCSPGCGPPAPARPT